MSAKKTSSKAQASPAPSRHRGRNYVHVPMHQWSDDDHDYDAPQKGELFPLDEWQAAHDREAKRTAGEPESRRYLRLNLGFYSESVAPWEIPDSYDLEIAPRKWIRGLDVVDDDAQEYVDETGLSDARFECWAILPLSTLRAALLVLRGPSGTTGKR
jgi:hypothetical protein